MKMIISILNKSIFLSLVLVLSACQVYWKQTIPKADIIFQANIYSQKNELGFMDADGANQVTLNIDQSFEKPVWSANGVLLYGLSGGTEDAYGYPAYWNTQNGSFKVCSRFYLSIYDQIQGAGNPNNPYEVIVQNAFTISLFDIARCKEVRRLVDYNGEQGNFANIYGFSYDPSSQELLIGACVNGDSPTTCNQQIIKLDLKTGKQESIGAGVHPAWSPDGTQIAYVTLDGLYVMGPDGSNVRRLVKREFSERTMTEQDTYKIPFLRWSTDGQWLVYHLCMDGTDEPCLDTNIYKLRVSDGLQVKLLASGFNPSWKP